MNPDIILTFRPRVLYRNDSLVVDPPGREPVEWLWNRIEPITVVELAIYPDGSLKAGISHASY